MLIQIFPVSTAVSGFQKLRPLLACIMHISLWIHSNNCLSRFSINFPIKSGSASSGSWWGVTQAASTSQPMRYPSKSDQKGVTPFPETGRGGRERRPGWRWHVSLLWFLFKIWLPHLAGVLAISPWYPKICHVQSFYSFLQMTDCIHILFLSSEQAQQ